MNVRQKLIEVCVSQGMTPTDAENAIERAIPEIEKVGQIKWHLYETEYPNALYAVMFLYVERYANDIIGNGK